MEVVYKRDQGHNYVLFPGEEETGVQIEMIRRNRIPGLADFYTEWENNQRYYGYDITGAKPLNRILEVRPFTGKEAEKLVKELAGALQGMEAFLLDRDKLVLKPELLYVYTDRKGYIRLDGRGFLFFFCEGQEGSYGEHLRELILYLLDYAEEEDRELTELLFGIYRICSRKEPEAEALLACLDFRVKKQKAEQESLYSIPGSCLEEQFYADASETEKEICAGKRKRWREKLREERKLMGERGRGKEGIPARKTGVLKKFFGGGTMSAEEMWDDLEPVRKTEEKERKEEQKEDETDRPTEILYVEEAGIVPALVEQEGKERIFLKHFPFYIGTQPGMDYCPKFHGVSRIHLKLESRDGDIWITDLNSTNGTGLNGETLRPNEERKLAHGDCVRLAGLAYEFDSGKESW